ncbi:hypothetical protein AX761_23750 [Rhizobium sp. 58]|nr:hypothetical protein AX761_23750 [Rhizobium sp. 58]
MNNQPEPNRRQTLQMLLIAGGVGSTIIASGGIGAAVAQSATDTQADLASRMKSEALKYLASLDPAKAQRSSFPFGGEERTRWHWTVTSTFPRNGVTLGELDASQYQAAMDLLAASLSSRGFDKVQDIMRLQALLPTGAADPLAYHVSVFGDPNDVQWGWRLEGHHLSHHFTVVDGKVSMTPFFHGSWPTTTQTGFRAMPREEDAARELVLSLTPALRNRVVFQENSLRHVTQNDISVSALPVVGLRFSELGNDQRALAAEIVATYLAALPTAIAIEKQARFDASASDALSFGWAGSHTPNQSHYYRIQSETFLLEFDNSLNEGTHIHSVWRDFGGDFGTDHLKT